MIKYALGSGTNYRIANTQDSLVIHRKIEGKIFKRIVDRQISTEEFIGCGDEILTLYDGKSLLRNKNRMQII